MDAIREAVIKLGVEQEPFRAKVPPASIITEWKKRQIAATEQVSRAQVKAERAIQKELATTAAALERVIALQERRAGSAGGGTLGRRGPRRLPPRNPDGTFRKVGFAAAGFSSFGGGFGGGAIYDVIDAASEARRLKRPLLRSAVRRFGAAGTRALIRGAAARLAVGTGVGAVTYAALKGTEFYYNRQNALAIAEGQRLDGLREAAQFSAARAGLLATQGVNAQTAGIAGAGLLAGIGGTDEDFAFRSPGRFNRGNLDILRSNLGGAGNNVAFGQALVGNLRAREQFLRGQYGVNIADSQSILQTNQGLLGQIAGLQNRIGRGRSDLSRINSGLGASGLGLLLADPFQQSRFIREARSGNLSNESLAFGLSIARSEDQRGYFLNIARSRGDQTQLNRVLENVTGASSNADKAAAQQRLEQAQGEQGPLLERVQTQTGTRATTLEGAADAIRERSREVNQEMANFTNEFIRALRKNAETLIEVQQEIDNFKTRQERLEQAATASSGFNAFGLPAGN